MDDNEPFERFRKSVEDLWPRYKTTPTQLRVHWGNVLARYSPSVVSAALSKAVSEYPDDIAPKWKIIFGYLAGRPGSEGNRKSEFQILLDGVRRVMKEPWGVDGIMRKGVDNMTDEDVWLEWVGAQTHERELTKRPDTERCVTCARTSRGECGLGHRECFGKRIRAQEYSRWRRYLEERGDPIPPFLLDDYATTATFVEPRQPSGTLF